MSNDEKELYFQHMLADSTIDQAMFDSLTGGDPTTASQAFEAGFTAGSANIDEAMNRLNMENQALAVAQTLKSGLLDDSSKGNAYLANTVGSTLIATVMDKSGIPLMMYKEL